MILVEAGTFASNMDPMKKSKHEEVLMSKYMNIINEIEDVHFEDDTVRADMLNGYKGAKKVLSGPNLLWKLDVEMRDVRKFAANFPGFNNPSELPSRTTQLRHMKKPVIMKLWKKKYPVMYFLLICVLLHCQSTLIIPAYLHDYLQDVVFVDYNDKESIGNRFPVHGGLSMSHVSICLLSLSTRTTRIFPRIRQNFLQETLERRRGKRKQISWWTTL